MCCCNFLGGSVAIVYQLYATREVLMADRGWAADLLSWRQAGGSLTAEVSRARYFVRAEAHEITAHAEVRDLGGRYRIEIGTYPTVALARAACEKDAAARCRREPVAGFLRSGASEED